MEALASVSFGLIDPGTDAGTPDRITLSELFDGLKAISTLVSPPKLTGLARIALPATANVLGQTVASGSLRADWGEVFAQPIDVNARSLDPSRIVVTLDSSLTELRDFRSLTTDDVLASLEHVFNYVASLENARSCKTKFLD